MMTKPLKTTLPPAPSLKTTNFMPISNTETVLAQLGAGEGSRRQSSFLDALLPPTPQLLCFSVKAACRGEGFMIQHLWLGWFISLYKKDLNLLINYSCIVSFNASFRQSCFRYGKKSSLFLVQVKTGTSHEKQKT